MVLVPVQVGPPFSGRNFVALSLAVGAADRPALACLDAGEAGRPRFLRWTGATWTELSSPLTEFSATSVRLGADRPNLPHRPNK